MSRGSDFWSRRKAAVEAEQAEETKQAEDAEARATQEELSAKSDEEVLEELGLPDPDTLEPGQDISGFMQKAVPERLRQRAMRKLWRLNPVLANLDGLCDYNDDFTNAATDAPGVATAYRVGKGLLKHIEALEEQEAAKQAKIAGLAEGDDPEVDTPPNTPENPSEMALSEETGGNPEKSDGIPENMQDNANAAPASTTMVQDEVEYANGTPLDTVNAEPVRPRRMRFRIESETG